MSSGYKHSEKRKVKKKKKKNNRLQYMHTIDMSSFSEKSNATHTQDLSDPALGKITMRGSKK